MEVPVHEAETASRQGAWGRLWPALVLLAAVLAFYAPALLEGRLMGAGDGIAQIFPNRVLAAESLKQGELPFWNPYNFGGMPLFATIHPGVLFPGNWTFLVLPPAWALAASAMGATWIAGLAMFAFGRAMGLSRAAGLVAGLTFMFGAFMVAGICALPILQTAGLAPGLLWAVERFRRTLRVRYALAGAAVIALMVLAGHPQMVAYGLVVAGAYALYRGVSVEATSRLGYVAAMALMVALGVGLALLQLLPTIDLITSSQREAYAYWQLAWGGLPPRALPTFLFPFMFGVDAVNGLFRTPYWGPGGWMEGMYGYVGLGAVMLGAVAVAGRDRRAWFWGAVALVALLLAMGSFTPVFWLWSKLPVVSLMPGAGRHLMEFTLAMAVLAGLGTESLSRRRVAIGTGAVGALMALCLAGLAVAGPGIAARTQPLVPEGIDMAAALSLVNPAFWGPAALFGLFAVIMARQAMRPGRFWAGALVAVVFCDLWLFGYHHGWRLYSQRAADFEVLPKVAEAAGRQLSVPEAPFPFLRPGRELRALGFPATSALEKRRSLNGYDAFIPRRVQAVLGIASDGFLTTGSRIFDPGHHALDMWGVRTVVLDAAVRPPAAFEDAARWTRMGDRGGMHVYRNERAMPRAWRPTEARVLPLDAIDRAVAGETPFDPRSQALVEDALRTEALAPGRVEAYAVSANRLHVETEGDGAGLVVVSESHDPGWRAFGAGRELPVHRVDGQLLGVEVPPGRHLIALRYEPRLWRAGLAGSGASLLLLAAWGLVARRRRRL